MNAGCLAARPGALLHQGMLAEGRAETAQQSPRSLHPPCTPECLQGTGSNDCLGYSPGRSLLVTLLPGHPRLTMSCCFSSSPRPSRLGWGLSWAGAHVCLSRPSSSTISHVVILFPSLAFFFNISVFIFIYN